MAERRWTAEQSAAINTRDRTLLVSAAAGSGKTATLTERIIRTLCDTDEPTSINELLVVTFTNAAAAEMRERITASLKQACAERPDDKHLQRQLMLLPTAKIRTIDSFCNDLLRLNADKVGVAPNYRILDGAEAQLLAFSVLEAMISAMYEGELCDVATAQEFEALADCLTGSKQMQRLSEVIYKLYDDVFCEIDPIATLREYREEYSPVKAAKPESSRFVSYYINKMRGMCAYYTRYIDSLISELSVGSPAERAYADTLEDDKRVFESIGALGTYAAIRDSAAPAWSRIPSTRGAELSDLQLAVRRARDNYKDELKSLKSSVFCFSDGDIAYCFDALYSRIGTLVRVLERFDQLFMSVKRRRAAFTYHDIERFTYECLWQGGERTDVALALAKEYKCVYIDEYQDVNALQDKIFEAVSRDNNRFMVGDIKQSIYAFRGAESEIFAAMKKSFPKLDAIRYDKAASIFMSENFRCDEGIINFVNGVFDKIFGVIGDAIGYESADRLKYGKGAILSTPPKPAVPTVMVIEDVKSDPDERGMAEPMAVAKEIRRLLDEERLYGDKPIRARDVAILMRKTKAHAADYAAALAAYGIPSKVGGEKDFFLNREILLALCLLNAIDNPQRDIYLAGLMRSPLFDFTADELWLVSSARAGSLYDSLLAYTEAHPDFKKGERLIAQLKKYRRLAESFSTSALIYKLYRETGLMAIAAKNGGKDNLTLLYNYARDFEGGEYKGLYSFISFINELISRGAQFDTKREGADADEVSIITTHSSKGLEYPVVFLAACSGGFGGGDPRNPSYVSLCRGFGISLPIRTRGGLARVEGIPDKAIKDFAKDKELDEEMRNLYVALTRARERLYVTGRQKDPEEYLCRMSEYGRIMTDYSVRKMKCALDVICATRPDARYVAVSAPDRGEDNEGNQPAAPEGEASAAEAEKKPCTLNSAELVGRFRYEYPYAHLTALPEKMSVSRLHPTVLDGVDEAALSLEELLGKKGTDADGDTQQKRTYPDFYTGKQSDESAKRGIATHLFMQFCDLEAVARDGAERELARLVERGFISEADGRRVRINEINAFARSELFSAMRGAKKIYRELRFNVRLPAVDFTADEQRKSRISDRMILVQGVIDCIIENEDGSLRLVDYKTDRLTREELADRRLAERTLTEKHKTQLGYYALAIESIFGRAPCSVQVYSLPLGDCVRIDLLREN